MTNFKRNSKVYLVMNGPSSSSVANYPTSGLVHHFTLENLTDGLVDKVSGGNTTDTINSGQITTGISSPTGKGFQTSSTKTAGVLVLSREEANAWEDENNEWSLSIWFKSETTSGGGDQNRIVSRDLSESFGVRINQNSTSNTLLLYGEPGSESLGSTTPNQWNNLLLTFDGTNIEAFVNGVSKGTEAYTRSDSNPLPGGLAVCNNVEDSGLQGNNGFVGQVSDLRLWNRELTQAEITAVYLNTADAGYELDVLQDLSFGQTFSETTTSVKTLHSEDFFEASSIVKANPADFTFTTPLLQESDNKIAFSRLLDCANFDLYIQSDESTFHLDNCVFTNGSFVIERSTELRLSLSGQAEKLTRIGSQEFAIPGGNYTRASSRRYLQPLDNTITLDSADISTEVFAVSAELQNEVSWNKYETVHAGIDVSSRANAMYPSGFTVSKKTFAGSVGRYLEDGSQTRFLNFDTSTPLRIKMGETISSAFYGIDFNMDACSFTSRMTSDAVFTEHFDWRLTSNSTLSTLINYNTL